MTKLKTISELPQDLAGISTDSRKIKQGYAFFVLKGEKNDGSLYIDDAIKNGASYIVSSQPIVVKHAVNIVVEDVRKEYALQAAKLYPNQPKKIVAVTGTNGKTSTVNYCRQLLSFDQVKAASIGTLGVFVGVEKLDTGSAVLTTPDPLDLHKILNQLSEDGVENVALEASSHGLVQNRLDAVKVKAAAFTNLSQDHLDYHKTFENYFKAKLKLFSEILEDGGTAVLNSDIKEFEDIARVCKSRGVKVTSFGRSKLADLQIKDIKTDLGGMKVKLTCFGKEYSSQLKMLGEFQVYNVLTALGLLIAVGHKLEDLIVHLDKLTPAEGRMQLVPTTKKVAVFVDYAHTPDSLEQSLQTLKNTIKDIGRGRLFVVFGCGGNRDQAKRPMMGEIAARLADFVVVTDDNPRNEDPAFIRSQIMAKAVGAYEFDDRRKAINFAISKLKENDMLLIAGKGHETYQIIGDEIFDFEDAKIAEIALKE